MTFTEEQKTVRKDFRAFLRTKDAQKGIMLNNLISAADFRLPALIRKYFDPNFVCIYDESYSLDKMLSISSKIDSNEEILASSFGYISSKAISSFIRFYADKNNINLEDYVPEIEEDVDYSEIPEFVEGEVHDTISRRYERNAKARKECIAAKGCICSICGFDFAKEYGEWGDGFIQVHHIVPINERGGCYRLNPIRDLIPICSNCHSMIHRKRMETLTPKMLREMYLEQHSNSV